MEREKQIEEMRLAISEKQSRGFLEIPSETKGCSNGELAEHLIVNKGYCKVSEVINKFSEELIKRFNDLEYQANTPRKTVKVDELRAQMDWVLHEVTINTIKEFTEKYVEAMK